MRRPRALVLKVAALQVGRREVPQVVRLVELQAVQPAARQVVQPAEARQVVLLVVLLLVVQPVPVRQVQLEQRVPQALWLVRLLAWLALSAWRVR